MPNAAPDPPEIVIYTGLITGSRRGIVSRAVYWNRRYEPVIVRRDKALMRESADSGMEVGSFNWGHRLDAFIEQAVADYADERNRPDRDGTRK